MVGRRSLVVAVSTAMLALGGASPALADTDQKLVMVTHSPFMIQQLESYIHS